MTRRAVWVLALTLWLGVGQAASCFADNSYRCRPNFEVPAEFLTVHDFHPVGYLESCDVANVSERLSPERLAKLKALFTAASRACKSKYGQDYPLGTSTPLYKLLKANIPSLAASEVHRGEAVFLGTIARVLAPPSSGGAKRSAARPNNALQRTRFARR